MGKSPDPPVSPLPAPLLLPRLYAIIDPAQTSGRSSLEVAEQLLAAGVRLIQLRDKEASSRELYSTAKQICERVRRAGGIFIVNDRADVALAVDADGVHLGQDDLPVDAARTLLGPDKLIGHSTHTVAQCAVARHSPVDYLAIGPIFSTKSKKNPDAIVGLEGLRQVRQAVSVPLTAIGGITLETAPAVLAAGADSVAVIRDLVGAPNIRARAEEFLKVLKS
jgi:thiamine-phosphate pyrophosphorylase